MADRKSVLESCHPLTAPLEISESTIIPPRSEILLFKSSQLRSHHCGETRQHEKAASKKSTRHEMYLYTLALGTSSFQSIISYQIKVLAGLNLR